MFIFGFPGDNLNNALKTINYAQLPITYLQFSVLLLILERQFLKNMKIKLPLTITNNIHNGI